MQCTSRCVRTVKLVLFGRELAQGSNCFGLSFVGPRAIRQSLASLASHRSLLRSRPLVAAVNVPPEFRVGDEFKNGVQVEATTAQVTRSLAVLSGHSEQTRERHYIGRDQHGSVSNAIATAVISDLVGDTAMFEAEADLPTLEEADATGNAQESAPAAGAAPLSSSQLLGCVCVCVCVCVCCVLCIVCVCMCVCVCVCRVPEGDEGSAYTENACRLPTRQRWTAAEEVALSAAAHEHSCQWQVVLADPRFGVLHTRRASSLRDKWRSMNR